MPMKQGGQEELSVRIRTLRSSAGKRKWMAPIDVLLGSDRTDVSSAGTAALLALRSASRFVARFEGMGDDELLGSRIFVEAFGSVIDEVADGLQAGGIQSHREAAHDSLQQIAHPSAQKHPSGGPPTSPEFEDLQVKIGQAKKAMRSDRIDVWVERTEDVVAGWNELTVKPAKGSYIGRLDEKDTLGIRELVKDMENAFARSEHVEQEEYASRLVLLRDAIRRCSCSELINDLRLWSSQGSATSTDPPAGGSRASRPSRAVSTSPSPPNAPRGQSPGRRAAKSRSPSPERTRTPSPTHAPPAQASQAVPSPAPTPPPGQPPAPAPAPTPVQVSVQKAPTPPPPAQPKRTTSPAASPPASSAPSPKAKRSARSPPPSGQRRGISPNPLPRVATLSARSPEAPQSKAPKTAPKENEAKANGATFARRRSPSPRTKAKATTPTEKEKAVTSSRSNQSEEKKQTPIATSPLTKEEKLAAARRSNNAYETHVRNQRLARGGARANSPSPMAKPPSPALLEPEISPREEETPRSKSKPLTPLTTPLQWAVREEKPGEAPGMWHVLPGEIQQAMSEAEHEGRPTVEVRGYSYDLRTLTCTHTTAKDAPVYVMAKYTQSHKPSKIE